MSVYTTELRYICESFNNDKNADINTIIDNAIDNIFDDFVLYNPDHKRELCTKILKHYYFREIGAETYGLWRFMLNRKISEILPYYNDLYKSADLKYNPLETINIAEDYTGTANSNKTDLGEGNSKADTRTDFIGGNTTDTTKDYTGTTDTTDKGSTSSIGNNSDKYSDTPQGSLTDVKNGTYLTNYRDVDTTNKADTENASNTKAKTTDKTKAVNTYNDRYDKGTNTTQSTSSLQSTSDSKNNYTKTTKGKYDSNTYMSMIKEYRDIIINIDMQFIDELKYLFMGVW